MAAGAACRRPTALTRLANKLAPGLLDRYLGATRVDSQQTDEPVDLDAWGDNLDRSLDDRDDAGAHGPFHRRARRHSPQLWAATHRPQLAAGLAGVMARRAAAW
jgi:hypothetical protein